MIIRPYNQGTHKGNAKNKKRINGAQPPNT